MGRISFLHVSDLHLTAPQRHLNNMGSLSPRRIGDASWSPTVLEGLSLLVHSMKESLDAVVISGDVADDACPFNMNYSLKLLASKDPLVSNLNTSLTILKSGVPVCISPGNHDRFDINRNVHPSIDKLFYEPDAEVFESVFGDSWSYEYSHCTVSEFHPRVVSFFVLPAQTSPIAFICADFTLKNKNDAYLGWMHYGHGRVYSDRLSALEQETEKVRDRAPDALIIWVVHFPTKADNVPLVLRLRHAKHLRGSALKYGIDLVLSGHTHAAEVQFLNKFESFPLNIVTGAATATNPETSHISGYSERSVLKIEVEFIDGAVTGLEIKEFSWAPNNFKFEESGSATVSV